LMNREDRKVAAAVGREFQPSRGRWMRLCAACERAGG
jgi:hypothetical protein